MIRRGTYDCSDGFCGAEDCRNCFPSFGRSFGREPLIDDEDGSQDSDDFKDPFGTGRKPGLTSTAALLGQ